MAVTRRLAEILGGVLDTPQPRCQRCQRAIVDDYRDELTDLLRWARVDRFDRRTVNRRLRRLDQPDRRAPTKEVAR